MNRIILASHGGLSAGMKDTVQMILGELPNLYALATLRDETEPITVAARRLLAGWQDLCEKYHCTPTQLVIALTARMIPGLHVLCGARTPEQVLDNAKALTLQLDGADAVRMKWDVDAIS